MTIKQQGGVFGRNPSFNTVETTVLDVDNLRLDGSTLSSTNTDGDIILDPNGSGDLLLSSGNFGINAATPSNKLQINSGNSASAPSAGSGGHGLAVGDAGFGLTAGALSSGNAYLQATRWDGIVANYNLVLQPNGGNVSVGSGNLAFASGAGIDFSATAGTGTSELFDDYEEGTWTPVYDASTSSPTVTHDKQTGYYVKIGRMVFISLQLRTDSVSGGSGNLRISGLPYSAGSGDGYPSALSVGYKADFVTNGPDFAHVNDGQTYLSLYSNGTTVATPLTVANLNTGSNDNGLYISGSYLTA